MADDLASLVYVNEPAGVVTYSPTFKVRHEVDLSEWDSISDGVTRVTPGLASTAGKMRVTLSGVEARYATKAWAQSNPYLHYRFYLDISGLSMASDDKFVVHEIALSGSPVYLVRIHLRYYDSGFRVTVQATDDAESEYENEEVIVPQDSHWIEVGMNRPTETAGDGAVVMYIDGYQAEPIINLDNYDIWENITEFRLGAVAGLDVGTSGYIDFDEVVLLDENRSSYL